MENIYADIAARTGGNIYIGVVGPVRTGKSTLVKRIMETLVIPHISDPYLAERAKDELPQSGSGKTIMTSEPKFVPEEAIEITPDGTAKLRVRMIDSVGYMIPGAVGATEEGTPRMGSTPWFDHEIPMTEAAELGTKKVMQEHCSIGFVVTTDGSITDIPRSDYLEAERKAIADMQQSGKPYLVIINSARPNSPEVQEIKRYISEQFHTEPIIADCQSMDTRMITDMLQQILYSFPLGQLQVYLPRWMDALEENHPVKASLYQSLIDNCEQIQTLGGATAVLEKLKTAENITDVSIRNTDLANGSISCMLVFPEKLFYEILSDRSGQKIQSDAQLLSLLTELSAAKAAYDKIADALAAVNATGYGIVMPGVEDTHLGAPELARKGGSFGVKLQAQAPSIHMIRVDVDTQLTPTVGSEQQAKELVEFLKAEPAEKLWQSNIFGKSVGTMIQEGLAGKLLTMPEDVQSKFRGSLSRVVNEGANGLICLIL